MAFSAMYALMLPHAGHARAVRSLLFAALMFKEASIDTKCDPEVVPSANPVPVAHDNNDDVRGAPVVDAGWCDIDDEPPLSQSGLPSNAVAQAIHCSKSAHSCRQDIP